jgi:Fe-S-cluster containining protein
MTKFPIETFRRRAYRKKKKLGAFLKKVAKSRKKGLLKTVAAVDKEVWKEVSCLSCANCCKKMTPTFNRNDISRISRHFNMTSKEFYDKWLTKDDAGDTVNKSTPCQFLGKDNRCTIYSIRPKDCAEFPHFLHKDFRYQAREKVYATNMPLCPATLVFVEKLQAKIESEL